MHLIKIHKEKWRSNVNSETSFWENWTKTKGSWWKKGYKMRTDPNSKLQKIFLRYINTSLPINRILDVGSGPLTSINKRCDLTELEIHAVDPLADEYNELLKKYSIQPIVKTQKLDGETLTEKYNLNSFDISYSLNAIDHAYDPLKIVEEMIKVTKKKGYIILQLNIKEGSRNLWKGLHKWDFFLNNNNLLLKGRNTLVFNVSDIFKDVARINQVKIENKWVISRLISRILKKNKLMTIVFKKL